MREITGSFGAARHLVGTLALPDATSAAPVGFILFNAGVIHRIGPHRFNVKLAHALAETGISSLRFDLSGQGDSQVDTAGGSHDEQAIRDVRAAMDHVERTVGTRRFVIAGVCSGAHHGAAVAREDARVVGLWMFDGHVYPTTKTRRARYQREIEQQGFTALVGRAWRRITRRSQSDVARVVGPESGPAAPGSKQFWPPAPVQEQYAATLRGLLARRVQIFMVHSGGFIDEYSYADQFKDGFGGLLPVDEIRCDFRPEIDHTITSVAAQRAVVAAIADWSKSFTVDQAS